MQQRLIAYATDFVSFLLFNMRNKSVDSIEKIILFGSVARGTATEGSDVDIFIDADPRIKKYVEKIKDDFSNSMKFKKYWTPLGIGNDIKCIVGKLNRWNELKDSIISDGIVLYGKYNEPVKGKRNYTVFMWENIRPDSKRILLNKRVFGYKHSGKFYQGLVQKFSGEKLGKGCVLIPSQNTKKFLEVFRKMKVRVKLREIMG